MAWSREVVATLFVVVAAIAFGAACGGGDETIEERWARLDVPEPEIVFLGDWTDEERATITREVKSVQVHHHERFGVVTSEFTLHISTEFEPLNEAYQEWLDPERRRGGELPRWFSCGGVAPRDAIFIVLEACDEEIRARGGPIAHEYFHVLQFHVGLVGGSGDSWPAWLVEGAAVYASTHHAEEEGRWTIAWRREAARQAWSSLGVCFPGICNGGMERRPFLVGLDLDVLRYEVGFLAVDWLVERKGEAALLEYFRLGGGRYVFSKAFGMTREEFGEAFDQHWREVAPPFDWRTAGRVTDPYGKPVGYARVAPLVRVEDERVLLRGDEGDSQGAFNLLAPNDGHTLGVFLKCPDGAASGWVFVGEWGADGFAADADGMLRRGDEGVAPVSGGRNRAGVVIELPATRDVLIERHCRA